MRFKSHFVTGLINPKNLTIARSNHTKSSLTQEQHDAISSMLRVNQAGEIAANYIYKGQLLVFKSNKELSSKIEQMWEQEKEHLDVFNKLIPKYNARPSLLTPFWEGFGLVLGATTALLGKEAAMACTEAVETTVGNHYKSQLEEMSKLGCNTQELSLIVERFRDEELEHLDTAIKNDSQKAPFYLVLSKVIQKGCEGAIWIAKRI